MRPVAILGAGGHSKVVIATFREAGREVIAVYDDNRILWGTDVLGVPVRGGTNQCEEATPAIIAVGDNKTRMSIGARTERAERWASAIHPRAYVHSSVLVGAGTVVFAGAVVQPDVRIGEHVIINTSACVDHDSIVGPFAHIGPGARLAGNVHLGKGVFVGMGATILPGVEVGEWATIGAGAVVLQSVEPGSTVVGNPARLVSK